MQRQQRCTLGSLDEYRSSLEDSREWFSREYPGVLESFQVLDHGFSNLGTVLTSRRDTDGGSHISLAPLLMLMQRQAFVALDALSSMQAYQAWVLVRPGIECALIMGKWMDDVANHHIWANRFQNQRAYRDTYTGKALISQSLPRSADLQAVLRSINDSFVHPNPDYYTRHIGLTQLENGEVEVRLHFFDDHDMHWASVLALVHLLILTQHSLARMFQDRFVNIELDPDHFGLSGFEEQHRAQAASAAERGLRERYIVQHLGLWDLAPEA
jgi:hypothetical protein